MKKYRPFILLGVAVIVAILTSILAYRYIGSKTKAQEPPRETQSLSVAVVDIPWGTTISKEMIKTVDFLKGTIPPGSFSDPSSLAGRVAIYPIGANEPILESRLAPVNIQTGGVAVVIGPGKRAVAVRVDKIIGVSGFIRQGHRVDVLATIPTGKTSTPFTKTVLENVLVLTVGSELEKKGKEEKALETDVITLEVTPEEAEKLALAAAEGKLQLTLKNFKDKEEVLTPGSTVATLLASYSGYAPIKQAKGATGRVAQSKRAVPGQPRTFTIELIKGSKLTELKLEGGE